MWARLPALVAAMSLPLWVPSAHTYDLAQSAAMYALLAVGYSVVLGLCGQFSLAHAAIFAVGAYTTAILTTDPHNTASGVALLSAIVLAGGAGTLMGLPAVRLRGDQLAVVTLFAGAVVDVALQSATPLTGGLGGITDVPPNQLLGHTFLTLRDEYLLAGGVVLVAVVIVDQLRRSGLGLAMLAVREDEVAARAAGIRVAPTKLAAFAISGVVAGAAGWLYAGRYATVTPARFDITLSVLIAVMVLLGGAGRTYGVVVAAGLLGTLERVLSDHAAVEEGLTGAAILLVVFWRAGVLHDAGLRVASWLRR